MGGQRAFELSVEGNGLIESLEDRSRVQGKRPKVIGDGVLDGAAHELETLQCVREHVGDCSLKRRGRGLPSATFVKIEVESSRRKCLLPDFPHAG